MLVDKQSELMSDLLFTVHQHGGNDVTWKPPIVREWNVHLEICSRPQVIENYRQCLLLRTDILQKRVAGCPCCFYLGYVHTISNSFSCRHEKLSSTVSDVTLHSRQLRSVTQKSCRSPFLEGGGVPSRFHEQQFCVSRQYETNFYVFTIFKIRGRIRCQKRYVCPIL